MGRRRRKRGGGAAFWLTILSIVLACLFSYWVPPPSGTRPRGDTYDRKDWRHWVDADRDCQDTRQEVLVAESRIPVRFHRGKRCKVRAGKWRCPYTGRWFTDPSALDVDHLVPLNHAHRSGGTAWNPKRKERYANALDDEAHLVAVSKAANRAKGSKGPDAWLPEYGPSRCRYVEDWIRIKQRWSLTSSAVEREAIDRIRRICTDGSIPPLPQKSG